MFLTHLIASGFLGCPQLQRSSVKVTTRDGCILVFFFFLIFYPPSQDDLKMTGAASKLEANAKDGFLHCSFLYSNEGVQEIKTHINLLGVKKNFYSFVNFNINN